MADSKKYDGSQWEHSLRKLTTATADIEPTIYSDGTAITAYTLKGNTTQSGTPTPSNPVDVQGVGNKTANLWSENYSGISENLTYVPIYVGNGEFTLSTTTPFSGFVANLFFLAGNVASGASTGVNGVYLNRNITVTAIDGYVTICYRNATANPEQFETMLNSGSTALDYEPYGYQIPISSANTTTPVYLGEVESTRRIKKLVFDGTEDWQTYASAPNTYRLSISNIQSIGNPAICSHFVNSPISSITSGMFTVGSTWIYIRYADVADLDDFKSYLAQQYANGTPVTVWYVLETPTTGIVNEPLMKIGTYADTLSNAASIPTTEGANSITVDTTVQPSEFTATWTGWHDSSVKEWDGSQWQ